MNKFTIGRKHLLISLIHNFICEKDEIEIDKNLSIIFHGNLDSKKFIAKCGSESIKIFKKQIGLEDGGDIIQITPNVVNAIPRIINSTKHIILWSPIYNDIKTMTNKQLYGNIIRVVSALRLYKNGYINKYPTFEINNPAFIKAFNRGGLSMYIEPVSPHILTGFSQRPIYTIRKNEKTGKLKNIFQKLKTSKRIEIELAINRLNDAYGRLQNEDKVLDILMGFEALYKLDINLSFKLALRVSFHLGRTSNEREDLYLFMRDAYEVRSELVHGRISSLSEWKKMKKYNQKPVEFINKLLHIYRESIKSILLEIGDDKYFKEELYKEFDTAIASGTSFRKTFL